MDLHVLILSGMAPTVVLHTDRNVDDSRDDRPRAVDARGRRDGRTGPVGGDSSSSGCGGSIRAIARELDLDGKTVRRCLRQGACGRVPAAGGVEAVPAGGAGGHAADRARGVSAAAGGGGRLRGEGSVPGAPAAAVRRELRDGEAVRAALAGDAAVLARSAFHNYARRYGREEARKENDDVKVGGPPVTTRAVVSPCYRRPIRTVVSPPHATHRRKRRLTLVVDHDERADTSGCESSPDRRRDPGLRRANTRCSACLGLRKPVWHTQAGSNYQHVVNARGFRNGDGNPCDLLMVHDLNDVVSGRNAPE